MKLTLLGTGTPAPSLKRHGSGYMIEIGDDLLLFDHGPGAQHRLLQAGKAPTDASHLFVSHVHYDHILDYPRLLLQRWDQGAGCIPELKVFGPPPIAGITDRLIGNDGAFAADIHARIHHQASKDVFTARNGTLPRRPPVPEIREIGPGDWIEGTGWRVRAGLANHMAPFMVCLGFRIETDAATIVYSGDNGGINPDMIDLASDCDILIHMCHFPSGMEPTPEFRESSGSHLDVAETAKRAKARTLVLTHMIALMDEPGVMERIVGEMRDIYDGTIIVGEDLMTVPLSPVTLSRID